MSLLNDALKAAEQRQNRPNISSAYTGQPAVTSQRRTWLPWLLLLVVLILAGGGAAWWWFQGQGSQPEGSAAATSESPNIEAEPATVGEPEPMPERQPEPEIAPEPIQPIARIVESEPESEAAAEPEPPATEPSPPAPKPDARAEPAPEPEQKNTSEPAAEPDEPADPAPVKQTRQTPDAIDRQTARELGDLLARGRTTEAEQRLTGLTENQPAPRSREVFAREMLIQQMPDRAMKWLPEAVTREHSNLRLLRARAQLEQGNLQPAINTLESRVPPVDASPEYRMTLATLLQQAGQPEASAGHWSELIAHDNNQPTWWLGLAMALEESGRTNSAVRAYTQAASMPELPDNLAEFAQQRLQALQAGQ